MIKTLSGYKTYIIGGITLILCIAAYFGYAVVPGITHDNAITIALAALGGMGLRSGITAEAQKAADQTTAAVTTGPSAAATPSSSLRR